MKHRISISILLSIFILVLAIIGIKFYYERNPEPNYSSTEEIVLENTNNSIAANQEYVTYMYYIKDDGGRLTVYNVKTSEIYIQTGIETHSLSAELREKLETGIFFENESDLYDFLESYSS